MTLYFFSIVPPPLLAVHAYSPLSSSWMLAICSSWSPLRMAIFDRCEPSKCGEITFGRRISTSLLNQANRGRGSPVASHASWIVSFWIAWMCVLRVGSINLGRTEGKIKENMTDSINWYPISVPVISIRIFVNVATSPKIKPVVQRRIKEWMGEETWMWRPFSSNLRR